MYETYKAVISYQGMLAVLTAFSEVKIYSWEHIADSTNAIRLISGIIMAVWIIGAAASAVLYLG